MKHLFKSHGIQTKEENGKLYALDVYFTNGGQEKQDWIDVTNWGEKKVKTFLGY